MEINGTTISAILASIFGSSTLTVIVSSYFQKKKTSADAADVLVKTIIDWASKLAARIEHLELELKNRGLEIDQRDEKIMELQLRVQALESKSAQKCQKCGE